MNLSTSPTTTTILAMSKKDKLGPLRNRLKEWSEYELIKRRESLTTRVAMDNREIQAIDNELKERAE